MQEMREDYPHNWVEIQKLIGKNKFNLDLIFNFGRNPNKKLHGEEKHEDSDGSYYSDPGEDAFADYSEGYDSGEDGGEPMNNFLDRDVEWRPHGKILARQKENCSFWIATPYAEKIVNTIENEALMKKWIRTQSEHYLSMCRLAAEDLYA